MPSARSCSALGRPLLPSPRTPGSALSRARASPGPSLLSSVGLGLAIVFRVGDLKLGPGCVAGEKGRRTQLQSVCPTDAAGQDSGRHRGQGQLCPRPTQEAQPAVTAVPKSSPGAVIASAVTAHGWAACRKAHLMFAVHQLSFGFNILFSVS